MTENIDNSLPSYTNKVINGRLFNQYNVNMIYQQNEFEESDKEENSEYISDENQSGGDSGSDDEVYDKKGKQDDKKTNILENKDELISIKIKTESSVDNANLNNFEHPPSSSPKNDPPYLMQVLINNQANNNDLSYDEVKEYKIFLKKIYKIKLISSLY